MIQVDQELLRCGLCVQGAPCALTMEAKDYRFPSVLPVESAASLSADYNGL